MAAFPPWTGYNIVKTVHHEPPAALKPNQQTLKSPFVVVVTGASRGIGAHIAKAFAAAGATGLILTARTEFALYNTRDACQATAKVSDVKISLIGADAGSAESAKHIAKVVEEEHGRLDLLINSAGIMCTDESAFAKLDSIKDDQFQDITQINYIGRFHTVKNLIPLMLSSSNGSRIIVNISSISVHLVSGTPVPFNISELATSRLTEAVAEMYAEEGVLAFAVHPGMVKTTFPPGFPEYFEAFCVDDPGLCGAFLVWLVSERRVWLSGRYMSSNWGTDELEGMREEIVEGDELKMRMVV